MFMAYGTNIIKQKERKIKFIQRPKPLKIGENF